MAEALMFVETFDCALAETRDMENMTEEKPLLKVPDDECMVKRMVTSGYLVDGIIPLYMPPATAACLVILAVFGLPTITDGELPYPTTKMVLWFAVYIVIDFLLKLVLSLMKWGLLRKMNFTQEEVALIAGPEPIMPTQEFLDRGGIWLYRCDSWGRKAPHVLHWAGLAWFINHSTTDTWSRFQFSVMGATCSVTAQLLCYRTPSFFMSMWIWLSVVRTADGYARRMNNLYCTISSICGMGVVVPVCSSLLASQYSHDPVVAHAFLKIITYPCAYGDCLAEIVGVNGKLRFKVYGIGEINNKSVEGMVAMFLGSVIPCLDCAWAIGGWQWLVIPGVLATIAETWAPRGFDNVFIPGMTALGVFISCSIQGGPMMDPNINPFINGTTTIVSTP